MKKNYLTHQSTFSGNRKKSRITILVMIGCAILLSCLTPSLKTLHAQSGWPCYRHDMYRSGVTDHKIPQPVEQLWVYRSAEPPQPAWGDPQPAIIEGTLELPRIRFDDALHVAAVNEMVYFGSSVDNKVYALNAQSGKIIWEFFTEGPVRLAPTIFKNRVYVGSDDGFVYCLDCKNGKLIWKLRGGGSNQKVLGSGKMISLWPIRTGVLVDKGIAYFGAGVFPGERIYMYAVDADDGSVIWRYDTIGDQGAGQFDFSPQGYILASEKYLFATSGRRPPFCFSRVDGSYLYQVAGGRTGVGTYALISDEMLFSGTQNKIAAYQLNSGKAAKLAWAPCQSLVITPEISYLADNNGVRAIDRAKLEQENNESAATIWQCKSPPVSTLIATGGTIFAGGENEVTGIDRSSGKVIWSGSVEGQVRGLAAAEQRLLVSTDLGHIYCFGSSKAKLTFTANQINATVDPFEPDDLTAVYEKAADFILTQTGFDHKKGYCFVYGAGRGRLAYELARRSEMKFFGIEPDANLVAQGQAALLNANLYGNRITLHQGTLDKLNYNDYSAALVVSDSIIAEGKCTGLAAQMYRIVRPAGGIALIGQPPGCPKKLSSNELEQWLKAGELSYSITEDANGLWAIIERGPLPGAGQWTKMWSDLGNTACSQDERITDKWQVLWYGQPGPRVLVERHARPMTDLYKNGKWVIPGAHRVICVDAYNGARLWDLPVPDSSRVGINSDAGWVTLNDDFVFVVAQNKCMKVDVETGDIVDTFHTPKRNRDWGYVAVDQQVLYGSEQIKNASVIRGAGGNYWRTSHGDLRPVITSVSVFCSDADTGRVLWQYNDESVIANPTICVSNNAMFFIESRSNAATSNKDGQVLMADFTDGPKEHLVKLDKKTGKLIWRKQFDLDFQHSVYLSYANSVLLASGARTDKTYVYDFRAFSADSGELLWSKDKINSSVANDSHGYQDKHPMIVDDKVFFKYGSFDLQTGESLNFKFGSSNCSDFAASKTHFFSRNSGCASIYSFANGKSQKLSPFIRPGCYISTIPAGGIIMLPAFSSGCTCDYPIQTTIAWQPQ